MKKIIASLLLMIFLSCNNKNTKNFKDGSVEFISVDKIPIVVGTLNGKQAYFIMDSGASVSILDETQSKDYEFRVGTESPGEISGYGGNSSPKDTYDVNVEIGGVKFDGIYRSQDLTNIISVVKESTGLNVVGIVGSNIMKEIGLIIDYDTNSLYLKDFVTIQPK